MYYDDEIYPFILGTGQATTLPMTEKEMEKVKKKKIGFHKPQKKVKSNGRRTK